MWFCVFAYRGLSELGLLHDSLQRQRQTVVNFRFSSCTAWVGDRISLLELGFVIVHMVVNNELCGGSATADTIVPTTAEGGDGSGTRLAEHGMLTIAAAPNTVGNIDAGLGQRVIQLRGCVRNGRVTSIAIGLSCRKRLTRPWQRSRLPMRIKERHQGFQLHRISSSAPLTYPVLKSVSRSTERLRT